MSDARLSVPNLITGLRVLAAPGLLWLAWHGRSDAFLVLLALALATDLVDGPIARLYGQVSTFGARLDSFADFLIYATVTLGAWWLWPDFVRAELLWIGLIVASIVLPTLAGIVKFRTITSYHVWSVKLAAVLTGVSLYLVLLGGPAWPFRIAALVCAIAALEELVITVLLDRPYSDVRSLFALSRRAAAERDR
ncbi:MAG: CDP-alcohol phosphatidyltransferase family protein [Gammaproteobacteria bacterium]|nr:CDP-alcohol phosphatidyltransferase family protein [Gammaproteobacteria bacterium]